MCFSLPTVLIASLPLPGSIHNQGRLGSTTIPAQQFVYGWLGGLKTTTLPDGTYTIQSAAFDAGGEVGRSKPVTVRVDNSNLRWGFRSASMAGSGTWSGTRARGKMRVGSLIRPAVRRVCRTSAPTAGVASA